MGATALRLARRLRHPLAHTEILLIFFHQAQGPKITGRQQGFKLVHYVIKVHE